MVRMPFAKFLAAVLLGELILCGLCIALGQRLLG
jgi:membrane protein DedA with SNARE-associated domain